MRWLFVSAVFALAAVSSLAAQDGATALAGNYRVLLQNDEVLVVRVHYAPHETLPVHDHSHYPTVYVYLADSGPVRFSHEEAQPFTLTRRPVKAGWFRVSPGRVEKHTVANPGPVASDFLRVELKRIPLGQISSFRYRRDVDLTKSNATTDYSSREMEIRRYVVTAGTVQRVAATPEGRLLIAFTSAAVRERGKADRQLGGGSVLWVDANTPFEVLPAGTGAAHVLDVRLLENQ